MDSDDQGLLAPGAALLLIIGEPFSEEQKTLILGEITKGFRGWDVEDTGININEELAQIANRASLGEEGVNASKKPGERYIQHQSDNLSVEILIHPLAQTVKNSVKKLLIASSATKYIIYAGHVFQGTGAWVLQDDTFAFSNLAQIFKNVDVENALKQNIEANLTIHTLAETNWGNCISKADVTNNLRIQLNPPEKLDNIHGVLQFTAYVGNFVKVYPVTSLLQASEQFGNISFTKPTLYIFPGCQGDSALFGINGFNLLVNGGYSRRACFWDFARHLDRVDAMLMTHLGTDNLFGLSTVLQRKSMENIHPQIGYLYFNALDKVVNASANGDAEGNGKAKDSLLINLAEEANKMTQMAKQLGISPHPCSRSATNANCEPVNLYHKLGHGSLDMYILNPVTDSKELKEFYQQWSKQAPTFGSSGPFPLQNALSVCTLLVWKPYNFDEKIVRIFFPGNAPQHKVIEGFEKMKSFGFLKHASCTTRDLMKPPAVKKAAGGSARPASGASTARSTGRAPTSARSESGRGGLNSSRVESPRKAESRSAPAKTEPKATAAKPSKPVKEEPKKTATKARPKPEEKDTKARPAKAEEKDTKAKTATTKQASGTSPTKASTPRKTPSPAKAASPTKSPSPPKSSPAKSSSPAKPSSPTKSSSPPKSPTKAKSPEAAHPTPALIDLSGAGDQAANHVDQQQLKPESEQAQPGQQDQVEALQAMDSAISAATDALPEPLAPNSQAQTESSVDAIAVDKQKLEELGIFDGDQKGSQLNGGDNFDAEDEEVKPQALPEPPVIVESPSQESDMLPDYSSKIESDEQELDEFSRAEEELEEDAKTSLSFTDPAQEIPPSPEPAHEEQTEVPYSTVDKSPGFDTPIFTNDVPEAAKPSLEQNIQYGIDDLARGRDMGGIQEVDEEEHEESINRSADTNEMDKAALREMGIYDEDEDEDRNEGTNAFYKDSNPDDEEIRQTPEKEEEEEEEVKSDCRTSAERQFEDVDDNSSLPAAFDKDSSPEVDAKNDETDSLDGGTPDDDKDIDETMASEQNNSGPAAKTVADAGFNSFTGLGGAGQENLNNGESDDETKGKSFDPVAEWGQPMGLPSPPPAAESKEATSPTKRAASAKAGAGDKTSRTARNGTATADAKKRPTTAPAAARGASRPGTATRRPGTGSSRSSPATSKVPPLPPMTPFYVDLTYIPNHGDPAYCDIEFFKRIRARYYVISSLAPNPEVLDCLVEAKATWDQKDLEVTLIPTYDNETLRHWMALKKEKLQELRIDMTPAVSRCTIQLQDLETSLPAYRLEV